MSLVTLTSLREIRDLISAMEQHPNSKLNTLVLRMIVDKIEEIESRIEEMEEILG